MIETLRSQTSRIEIAEATTRLLAKLVLPELADACQIKAALVRGEEPVRANVDAVAVALAHAWVRAYASSRQSEAYPRDVIQTIFNDFDKAFTR